MTTVQEHIKELLFEQDCVVIPDFGGFVTNFDSANINTTKRFISPPQKWLAFNALLKNDDGLLSNYIAREENISISHANLKVKAFVEDVRKNLRMDYAFSIDGLGTFSQNEEAKIQFQPKPKNNFYSESFGMENIMLKKSQLFHHDLQVISQPFPVSNTTIQQVFAVEDREPMAEVLENEEAYSYKKGRFSNVLPYVYGIFGSILLVSSIYLYDNQKSNLSSLNPFQSQSVIALALKPITPKPKVSLNPPKVIDEFSSKVVIEKKSVPIEPAKNEVHDAENRFFIITGSFGSKQNAKNFLNTLKNNGFPKASIIYPKRNEKLIKVSVGAYSNESIAEEEARKIAGTLNQSTWIYKN